MMINANFWFQGPDWVVVVKFLLAFVLIAGSSLIVGRLPLIIDKQTHPSNDLLREAVIMAISYGTVGMACMINYFILLLTNV